MPIAYSNMTYRKSINEPSAIFRPVLYLHRYKRLWNIFGKIAEVILEIQYSSSFSRSLTLYTSSLLHLIQCMPL